jgi:long-chain acyl-CoA synthetase
MDLVQEIYAALDRNAEKVLCRDSDCELTGHQMLAACQAARRHYQAAADRLMVGVILPSCAHYPAALFGAMAAGKVPVPLNPLLKTQELDFIFKETGIEEVVTTKATAPAVSSLKVKNIDVAELCNGGRTNEPRPSGVGPGNTALMLYTSGTTGNPKGVPLSHRNLLTNARAVIERLAQGHEDVVIGVLPLYHAYGLMGTLIAPLLLGAETTFLRFTPQRVAKAITLRHATIFLAVPTMYRLIARSRGSEAAFASLRLALCGGDALPACVRDAYRQRFSRELLELYGLSETSPGISVNTPTENMPGTVGRPLPNVKVRISGDDGADVPVGKPGEVQVKGPNVMTGYFNRPAENKATFTADGWFRTGDLGFFNAQRYLTIASRIKELIVRDAEKIMPREVEEVLELHPMVAEAAVVGEPDGTHGEAVAAYLIPAPDQVPSDNELREFCRQRLADFKVPRRFVIGTDLPRGATGKILKRALHDWQPQS